MRISVRWVAGVAWSLALSLPVQADILPPPQRPQPPGASRPEPKPLRKPLPTADQPAPPSAEDTPQPAEESPAPREPSGRPASCQPMPRQAGLGLWPLWCLLLVGTGLVASRRRWA